MLKTEFIKEKLEIFLSLKGKFDWILINIVILDEFGYKKNSLFRLWKS